MKIQRRQMWSNWRRRLEMLRNLKSGCLGSRRLSMFSFNVIECSCSSLVAKKKKRSCSSGNRPAVVIQHTDTFTPLSNIWWMTMTNSEEFSLCQVSLVLGTGNYSVICNSRPFLPLSSSLGATSSIILICSGIRPAWRLLYKALSI